MKKPLLVVVDVFFNDEAIVWIRATEYKATFFDAHLYSLHAVRVKKKRDRRPTDEPDRPSMKRWILHRRSNYFGKEDWKELILEEVQRVLQLVKRPIDLQCRDQRDRNIVAEEFLFTDESFDMPAKRTA